MNMYNIYHYNIHCLNSFFNIIRNTLKSILNFHKQSNLIYLVLFDLPQIWSIYKGLSGGILYSFLILFLNSPKFIIVEFFEFLFFWLSVILIVIVESFFYYNIFFIINTRSIKIICQFFFLNIFYWNISNLLFLVKRINNI